MSCYPDNYQNYVFAIYTKTTFGLNAITFSKITNHNCAISPEKITATAFLVQWRIFCRVLGQKTNQNADGLLCHSNLWPKPQPYCLLPPVAY